MDRQAAAPVHAGNEPGPEEATATMQRRTGPRVRRSLAKVNAEPIEADMFSHILMDDSGEAARVFLTEKGDLELRHPAAVTLGGELETWSAEAEAGRSPREFVLERWNLVGDGAYRSLVSQLINKEDFPDRTDFAKVVRDCLDRLRQGRAAAGT